MGELARHEDERAGDNEYVFTNGQAFAVVEFTAGGDFSAFGPLDDAQLTDHLVGRHNGQIRTIDEQLAVDAMPFGYKVRTESVAAGSSWIEGQYPDGPEAGARRLAKFVLGVD